MSLLPTRRDLAWTLAKLGPAPAGLAFGLTLAIGALAVALQVALRPARRRLLADHRRRKVARRPNPLPRLHRDQSARLAASLLAGDRAGAPRRRLAGVHRRRLRLPQHRREPRPRRRDPAPGGTDRPDRAARVRRRACRAGDPAGPILLRARPAGGALRPALPRARRRAGRARARRIGGWRSLAGVGAGAMAAIKPPYALVAIALAPYLARRIGVRALIGAVEYYVAAAVGLAYVALVVAAFPALRLRHPAARPRGLRAEPRIAVRTAERTRRSLDPRARRGARRASRRATSASRRSRSLRSPRSARSPPISCKARAGSIRPIPRWRS